MNIYGLGLSQNLCLTLFKAGRNRDPLLMNLVIKMVWAFLQFNVPHLNTVCQFSGFCFRKARIFYLSCEREISCPSVHQAPGLRLRLEILSSLGWTLAASSLCVLSASRRAPGQAAAL